MVFFTKCDIRCLFPHLSRPTAGLHNILSTRLQANLMLGAELPLRFDALKAISLQIYTPDWQKFRTIPKIPTPSAVPPVNIDI